jgi:hypothetical protein
MHMARFTRNLYNSARTNAHLFIPLKHDLNLKSHIHCITSHHSLIMEAEAISKMLLIHSTLTQQIADLQLMDFATSAEFRSYPSKFSIPHEARILLISNIWQFMHPLSSANSVFHTI